MPTRASLGIDNYSLRGRAWTAERLLSYASDLGLHWLFLSNLDVFSDRSDHALGEFGRQAADQGIRLHVGTLSVCPSSILFDPARGTALEQMRETIRVAKAVGSPIARCVLGRVDDRFSDGGIEAKIQDLLDVIRTARSSAEDAGARIAVENHSGDLSSLELRRLIEAAGPDLVGAVYDSGNAFWAMEDPFEAMENLAPYIVSTGIRDGVVWRTELGATLQWTAVGEGVLNWTRFRERFEELCPGVPMMIETISGRPNPLPYRPEVFPAAFRRLLDSKPPLTPGPHADADYQQQELERSLSFLRAASPL